MYLRPTELGHALDRLAAQPLTVLAGGTDFYPARVGRAIEEDVLDITAIAELGGIREEVSQFRIGALARWSEILAAPLPRYFNGLKLAAREIGGRQIQNAGTVGGNLCNASPAADGVPALMALDADVELAGAGSTRTLPLTTFILGNRKTARAPHELLTAILVPKWGSRARADFLKLGARKYMVISIVMVSIVVALDDDRTIGRCGIAVGSCAAAAQRLRSLESSIVGKRLTRDLASIVDDAHLAPLSPLNDIRGTAEYRMDATLTLLRRAIERLADAEG